MHVRMYIDSPSHTVCCTRLVCIFASSLGFFETSQISYGLNITQKQFQLGSQNIPYTNTTQNDNYLLSASYFQTSNGNFTTRPPCLAWPIVICGDSNGLKWPLFLLRLFHVLYLFTLRLTCKVLLLNIDSELKLNFDLLLNHCASFIVRCFAFLMKQLSEICKK